MTNSQNFSQTLSQNLENSKNWQITTLAKHTKFTGLGNFGTREIDNSIPVLINQKGQILAIPGLIGTENSKSENDSLDLILEVANFDGEMVAKSAFDLDYRSDASKIWAGNVSQNLPELFGEKMVEILNLWQKEMKEGSLDEKNKNQNPQNSSTNQEAKVTNLENQSQNSNSDYINSAKLWKIKPILQWKKNNQQNIFEPNSNEDSQNFDQKSQSNKDSSKEEQELKEEQGLKLKSKLKIDFEYLAKGLDSQGTEFWRPIIIQKLNIIGKYDPETGFWQSNLFYGNITTLQGLLCDLIRLIGFEKLKTQNLTIQSGNNYKSLKNWELIQKIKNFVQSFGFNEVITRPFISTKNAELFEQFAHKVINPYNSNLPFLRNSLLPSLLQIASQNSQKGWKNLNIFEINQIFETGIFDAKKDQNSIHPKLKLGIISLEDPYLLTTLAHLMAKKLGFDSSFDSNFEMAENNLGQITNLNWSKDMQKDEKDQKINFKIIQIKNSLKKEFGLSLEKVVWYLEVEIGNWQFDPLDKYFDELDFPTISRDYSLSVQEIGSKNWQKITQIINQIPADFVVKLWPKEYFTTSKQTKENNLENKEELKNQTKNETKIAFKVKFQSTKETLKNEQIDTWEKELMKRLTK